MFLDILGLKKCVFPIKILLARKVIHLQHLLGAQAALRLEAEGRAQVPGFLELEVFLLKKRGGDLLICLGNYQGGKEFSLSFHQWS